MGTEPNCRLRNICLETRIIKQRCRGPHPRPVLRRMGGHHYCVTGVWAFRHPRLRVCPTRQDMRKSQMKKKSPEKPTPPRRLHPHRDHRARRTHRNRSRRGPQSLAPRPVQPAQQQSALSGDMALRIEKAFGVRKNPPTSGLTPPQKQMHGIVLVGA